MTTATRTRKTGQLTVITDLTTLTAPIPSGVPVLGGDNLVEVASGFLFLDDYDRSDRDLDGDNGWTSTGGAGIWSIVSNVARKSAAGANNLLHRTIAASKSQNIIAEFINVAPTDRDSMMVRWKLADPTSDTWYRTEYKDNAITLLKNLDGTESQLATVGVALVNPYRCRMVLRDAGANTTIKVYTDATLQITHTDTAGIQADLFELFGFRLQDNPNSFDDALMCGVDVVCVNMLAGYKIALDGGTKVTESGGVAVINVDALLLPWTKIELFDGADALKDDITPVGGGWGGHQFMTVP